jgi:hypothetical protein
MGYQNDKNTLSCTHCMLKREVESEDGRHFVRGAVHREVRSLGVASDCYGLMIAAHILPNRQRSGGATNGGVKILLDED